MMTKYIYLIIIACLLLTSAFGIYNTREAQKGWKECQVYWEEAQDEWRYTQGLLDNCIDGWNDCIGLSGINLTRNYGEIVFHEYSKLGMVEFYENPELLNDAVPTQELNKGEPQ